MIKKAILALLLSISFVSIAQEKLTYIDPVEQLKKAENLYNEEKNEEVIKLLQEIHENDSVYYSALLLKVKALSGLEEYQKIIDICTKVENEKSIYKYNFKLYKGVALLRLEQDEKAISHFKQMLINYPYNYLVHYNLAASYENADIIEKAIKSYQTSILYNPFYSNPHLNLGNICYKENLISQALLCYNMYLLLNPVGNRSLNVLAKINKAVSSKNEEESRGIRISDDDESFEEIDLLINNYVALNKKYKISSKIAVPIVKQNHLLFEKLSSYQGNGGFWEKKYVPFYQELYASGYFNDFVYRIMSSTTNEKYKSLIAKSKGESKFIKWIANEWINIIGNDNTIPELENKNLIYTSNGELLAISAKDTDGNFHGTTEFFHKTGNLSAKGDFNHSKREGYWFWKNETGLLYEETHYKNGLVSNKLTQYHDNGTLRATTEYHEDKPNGIYKKYGKYGKYGNLVEKSHYKNDTLTGVATIYYPLGKGFKELEIPYENGNIHGNVIKYYPSGEKLMEAKFNNGTRAGKEIQYFRNGNVSHQYLYNDKGELHGEFNSYYKNEQVEEKGGYISGNISGEWVKYYKSGAIISKTNYNEKGKIDGKYTNYDKDGKIRTVVNYKNGLIIDYKIFDSKGSIIKEEARKNDGIYYEVYSKTGSIIAHGKYNRKDEKEGDWKYYSKNGFLLSEETYKDGKITGQDYGYYSNGALKSLATYKDGEIDDYYCEYYIDSTKLVEGYYNEGMAERIWLYYDPDGTISDESFFFHDEKNGYENNFSVDGKLFSKGFFEEGQLIHQFFYDTSGKEIDHVNYAKDSLVELHYPNGKIRSSQVYLFGYAHGDFTWYYPNGQVETKGNYFNGKKHLDWSWYNDKGILTQKGRYNHGDYEGTWYSYHDSGKLASEKTYIDGMLQGKSRTYNQEGILTYESNFLDGEYHGETKFYSDKGELQMIRYYHYGDLTGFSYLDKNGDLLPEIPIEKETGPVIAYYQNGQKSREFEFLDGKFHGTYKKYHSNGKPASEDTYTAGIQTGKSIDYYDNEQIELKRYYLNDHLHGDYIEYYKNGQIKEKLIYINGVLSGSGYYYEEDGNLWKKVWYFNGQAYSAEYY